MEAALKKFILALGIALFASGAAVAADLPTKKSSPIEAAPAPFSWTGGYVGLQGGYGWGNSGWLFTGPGTTNSHNENNAIFGAEAGYNYEFSNNFVVGAEASVAVGQFSGNSVCPNPAAFCRTTANFEGDLSVRAGYAIDRALIYAKGGVAFVNEDHFVDFPATTTLNEEGGAGPRAGYLLGLGLEYAITNNISAKIEYNYIGLGTQTFNFSHITDGSFVETTSETQNYQLIKLGLNYKF